MTIIVKGITEYGMKIQQSLVLRNEKQEWLIERVSKETGLYFDGSYLYKIMVGKLHSPKVIAAINNVLGIEE